MKVINKKVKPMNVCCSSITTFSIMTVTVPSLLFAYYAPQFSGDNDQGYRARIKSK